jgi:NADH-quinone oxidoreductase subunit G
VAVAVARIKGVAAPVDGIEPDAASQAIAASLCSGSRVALLAGNAALQHPQAALLQAWIQWIADAIGARHGVLGEGANSVGGYLAGARPSQGGLDARAMIERPLQAYLLWGVEPEHDSADPARAVRALSQASTVIACSAFRNGALEYAHAILPIATFAETAGTFVNIEGRVQSFNGAVRPPGEARPGWKVLRVLGNQLGLPGFEYESPEDVRASALPAVVPAWLSNRIGVAPTLGPDAGAAASAGTAERIADVPPYFTDPIVRRAASLQKTADAHVPRAYANAATLARFGLRPGAKALARQGGDAAALLECALDAGLPDGVVRVAAGHAATSTLGDMFGQISLEHAR